MAGDQDVHRKLVEEQGDPMQIKACFRESESVGELKPVEVSRVRTIGC